MRAIVIASLTLIMLSGRAHAWGDTGHKVVCEIAYRLVQADTRAAIRKLIRSDQEFDTFSDSCVYPDHPRKRAPEHFINLARDSPGLTSDDCPASDKCVLTAILNDSKVLGSSDEKPRDRLLALKFLGHWVGDIHQPLHVSFEDDRGGNNIHVQGDCGSGTRANLHSAWDSCLVEDAVGTDIQQAATDLLDGITPQMITSWQASEPRDWANESFAIAESAKTRYCVQTGSTCNMPNGDLQITREYLDANEPIVREQLQKAGVRLARLLDIAFGSTGK
ncbi:MULTISPECIES: S1/P1 nuclease [unclassified Bradyrhizobium]|uniref:S1/P1 nuclease n=1 Tax=unclassified Bradyrhizobium TaxID=2631580 RepID=UPI0028E9785F|nr:MULTISPECIES: S1/P1 nuclease [unclassified Bradyrhizobium]